MTCGVGDGAQRSGCVDHVQPEATLPRRALLVFTYAVAVASVLLAGCERSSVHGPIDPLIEAVASVSPHEGRLIGFERPASAVHRRAESPRSNWRLLGAAANLRDQAVGRPAPDVLHALGVACLLLGEWDEAIEHLESSEDDPARPGRKQNDLAAAYLARAAVLDRPSDYYRAVARATRAIDQRPDLVEAHFNRALALEKANFAVEARAAWEDYLRLDADSAWSAIARDHLTGLQTPTEQERWEDQKKAIDAMILSGDLSRVEGVTSELPQQSRFFVQDELLPRWGAAFPADSSKAGRLLDGAEALATRLAERYDDHLALDTVRAIRLSDAGRQSRLARAHMLYASGREAYGNRRYEDAIELFTQCSQLLGPEHPFALQARFYISASRFNQNRYDDALTILEELESSAAWAPDRYRTLQASLSWIRGLVAVISGRPWESVAHLEESLEIYTGIGETEHAASILAFLAETYRYLGEPEVAWKYRHQSLVLLSERGSSVQLHPILKETTRVALEEKNEEIARLSCERQLHAAVSDGDAAREADALSQRAVVRIALGEDNLALDDLRRARNVLPRIEDLHFRERVQADLALSEATIRLRGDARTASTFFDEAIEEYRRTSHDFLLTSLYLQRAQLRVRLAEDAAAEADLYEALRLIESQRQSVLDERARIAWLERFHETFEELIRLLTDQGRWHEAFDVTEQYRARALLDRTVVRDGGDSSPWSSARPATHLEIMQRMPERTALVSYAVLSDRIVGWTVRRDGVRGTVLSDSPEAVEQLILRLRSDIHSGASSFRRTAETLHKAIFRPLADPIGKEDRLVFIPDGPLHEIPFAVLLEGRTGRHLIEDHALMIAPSGSSFITGDDDRVALEAASVLVVGDPMFDKALYPRLSRLRHARTESEAVARLYSRSELVSGEGASKRRVFELLPQSSILHFSGHAVADHSDPSRSFLLLAADGRDSGITYAHELPVDGFEKMSLVVLGACSTGGGRIWKSEGVGSLARAFLSRGVPAVVASVWDVEDESTSELLVGFHERLSRGGDPITALRDAQLEQLATAEVRGWSGFQLYGLSGF